MTHVSDTDLLHQIEAFYDAVPRTAARTEEFGPLTLFVQEGAGWPYYARPTSAAINGGFAASGVTALDVDTVRARQRELGIPETFEWVAEIAPDMRSAVASSGLHVHSHPLMTLAADTALPDLPVPDGVEIRIVTGEDPVLASALVVPHLAFAEIGTAIGVAGLAELRQATEDRAGDGSIARAQNRIGTGIAALAAAISDGVAICAGQYQVAGGVAEIVGVGTLPSARRRGLAALVTAALATEARANGIGTVFLSANDTDVARIYGKLGFRTIATALVAEPAEPAQAEPARAEPARAEPAEAAS